MYPKFLLTLTGLFILLLTACTGIRSVSNADNAVSCSANNQSTHVANKKAFLMGPPQYIPDTIIKAKQNVPIEKGGKYVFISPSYTRIKPEMGTEQYSLEVLMHKISVIKKFAVENNYDTSVAFFIDMRVKSGKERFLVVNLENSTIIKKGLVAHGKGNEKFTFNRKFSNDEGSNCTSLGIYKIGKSYTGAFGLSYKLSGLNKTNSNAVKRNVVLHSMGSIPYKESVWPITQSEGCPAVAPEFLEELATVLDNAPKNVLLYIYYGE